VTKSAEIKNQIDETLEEVPDEALLRPRHIYRFTHSIKSPVCPILPADLRKLRLSGELKVVVFAKGEHPYYAAWSVKRICGLPFKIPEACQPRVEVPVLPPLLRLRDVVTRIGVSRDKLEILRRDRSIDPFYKREGSKALYRTWQFIRLGFDGIKIRPAPNKRQLRRREVARWLGVTPAEIESWVPLVIKRRRGYFDRDEIAQKVLEL
jgi:hypothetical protein